MIAMERKDDLDRVFRHFSGNERRLCRSGRLRWQKRKLGVATANQFEDYVVMNSHSDLFAPLRIGALEVPNRVLMAPLTRNRAHADGTPANFAIAYYRQRASAGLIISEATQISAMGKGYIDTPGIHSKAHVEGWKPVIEAVHAAGGEFSASSGTSGGSATRLFCRKEGPPLPPAPSAPRHRPSPPRGPPIPRSLRL